MDGKPVVFEMPVHLSVPSEGDDCAGAKAIARTFGVKRTTVIDWKDKGAPILLSATNIRPIIGNSGIGSSKMGVDVRRFLG